MPAFGHCVWEVVNNNRVRSECGSAHSGCLFVCLCVCAGRSEATALQYGTSQACNMPCHGNDPTGSCGGPLANSVYRLPPKPVSSPTPAPLPVPGQDWTFRG